MSRTPNPPIKGHALSGGCQCGALPPTVDREAEGCPLPSAGAVKRWHREHKAEMRGVL